nr:hypothetical protein [Chitinophagales bacterium]
NAIPDKIGKRINCLFFLRTEKLLIEIFHPFDIRSKKPIDLILDKCKVDFGKCKGGRGVTRLAGLARCSKNRREKS